VCLLSQKTNTSRPFLVFQLSPSTSGAVIKKKGKENVFYVKAKADAIMTGTILPADKGA
jgi:hypothetical protein